MAQEVPNLGVSRKVFLKHQVNWNTVCGAIQDLPWHYIWLADNPVEVMNGHLSLLVGRYVPTKVIRVRNKDTCVGGSVLSICTEFLSDSRQRVVVDGAASEWNPIIFGVPQESVLGHLLFILYTCEMFELIENRLFGYTDDSTLLQLFAG